MGWNVVTLKYGRKLEAAFAQPGGEHLRHWIDDCPNTLYSALTFQGGAAWREALLTRPRPHPRHPRASSTRTTTTACAALMTNLGGHDMETVLEAFAGRRRRPADLLHRLYHQGHRPALRRPQGQPLRPDDAEQMAGFSRRMGIADGAGVGPLRRPRRRRAAELQAFLDSGAVPRRAGAPPHRGAASIADSCRAAARPADAKSTTQAAFGEILADDRGRGRRAARRPHRHHLARRHRLDQSRRLGEPARRLRPHTEATTSSATPRSPRRSAGACRRRASTSSSASPRTTCSCCWRRSACRTRCSARGCCRSARSTIPSSTAASMR